MIHLVFNTADVKVLQEVQTLDESLLGEVIQIHDDYAVGPIENIYEPEGKAARHQWWTAVLEGGEYEGDNMLVEKNDVNIVSKLVEQLTNNEDENIWIWAAQNKHDVCGYYWLLQHVKPFQGRINILYLNNLPFLNEKGQVFYPNWLSEIPAKEFLKAKKLAREITLSEFEVDPDEWTKLCNDNGGVRLLEGGKKIISENENFYDAELKKYITGDWQKATKIIGNFLSKAKHTTGDAFLYWRLKALVELQVLETQGGVKNVKDLEYKMV
jgi:Protein of unknown function/Domain of unknown function (DUF1835)